MSAKELTFREYAAVEYLSAFFRGGLPAREGGMVRVRELIAALNAAMFPGEPAPDQETWDAADNLVNRLFSTFTTLPQLRRDDQGYGFIEHAILHSDDEPLDMNTGKAIEHVLYLANGGVLHQLMECSVCGRVVLKRKKRQETCGEKLCSATAYARKPDFRDKVNATARLRYNNLKAWNAKNQMLLAKEMKRPNRSGISPGHKRKNAEG